MTEPLRIRGSGDTPRHIIMPDVLDRTWIEREQAAMLRSRGDCTLDFSATTRIDSAGVGLVRSLHLLYVRLGRKLILANIDKELLAQLTASLPAIASGAKKEDDFSLKKITGTLSGVIDQVVTALSVLAEMLYWGTIGLLKKQDLKRGALGEQMYQLGFKAFGIVGLLAFLIGLVLSLQSAIQLRTFGAGIFLAKIMGITMVRELGPLLTAIILAGRTGSATTAEIATMGVNEEIDALKTLGINPIQFVVVPKFWAITLTMPLLSMIATAAGIFGAYVVALLYLDLSTGLFLNELSQSLGMDDVVAGFVKSVVFSWLIIWIGAFYGLRVRGGAEAVGRETTSSVVTGIFIIIIADAIFSFIF